MAAAEGGDCQLPVLRAVLVCCAGEQQVARNERRERRHLKVRARGISTLWPGATPVKSSSPAPSLLRKRLARARH
jgi:hypothetical protein